MFLSLPNTFLIIDTIVSWEPLRRWFKPPNEKDENVLEIEVNDEVLIVGIYQG